MNKQELIEKIGNLDKLYGEKFYVALDDVLDLVKQLDEPGKVQIPQSVADWIEYCKVRKITLAHALYHSEEAKNKSVYRWLFEDEDSDNQETFARAWLDGYEVEKEKLYLVKIKCLSEEYKYLNYFKSCREWLFSEKEETKEYRTAHTRKELEEAGFSEVFNSPLFETVEVE